MRRFIANENEQVAALQLAFLGGTVGASTWRQKLIPLLTIPYFNPVVADWTSEDRLREEQAKANCTAVVYVVTPNQVGFYTPVEAAVSAILNKDKRVFLLFLQEEGGLSFDEHQKDSVAAIQNLLATVTAAHFCFSIEELAQQLNALGGNQA